MADGAQPHNERRGTSIHAQETHNYVKSFVKISSLLQLKISGPRNFSRVSLSSILFYHDTPTNSEPANSRASQSTRERAPFPTITEEEKNFTS
jgi:hypothetical protein